MRQIAGIQAAVKFNDVERAASQSAGLVAASSCETDGDAFRGAATSLRAELIGTNCAIALGIKAHGPSPVLALCRALVKAGHDPATPLDAYRGNTLALKVRSIGEGAKLTVKDNHIGKPVFRRWRHGAESGAAAPPVRETAPDRHPAPLVRSRPGALDLRQTVSLPDVCGVSDEGTLP